jgi:hypothetical protein
MEFYHVRVDFMTSYVLNIKLSDKFNTMVFSRLAIFTKWYKGSTITLHFRHGNTDYFLPLACIIWCNLTYLIRNWEDIFFTFWFVFVYIFWFVFVYIFWFVFVYIQIQIRMWRKCLPMCTNTNQNVKKISS